MTGRSELTDHYVRISFAAGGLLRHREVHPTMWIRLWFSDGEKLHQRAYTLVKYFWKPPMRATRRYPSAAKWSG
ncbi:putative siderophore-interacting protein [Mycobacteroides abscessus subsp. abscessus]|nr:putative siderophore-interacting protein [Mycobacteroides abscessus subsp. abscessus]